MCIFVCISEAYATRRNRFAIPFQFKECDRVDSVSFDYKPNGITFDPKSNGKISLNRIRFYLRVIKIKSFDSVFPGAFYSCVNCIYSFSYVYCVYFEVMQYIGNRNFSFLSN